jgi:chorismate dehydratase
MLARVARIPYLNAAPFYLLFGDAGVPLVDLAPRAMGEAARRGEVDAGPFSLMDWVDLEPAFAPVGEFIIGTRRATGSVLLFSREPVDALRDGARVALDPASATGAALTRVLLEERRGLHPVYVPPEAPDADARLVIGDPALVGRLRGRAGFPHTLDLGEAWWDWHRLPFVFAIWGIRKSLPPGEAPALADLIGHSLRLWEEADADGVRHREWGARLGLEPAEIGAYLKGLVHRNGPEEREAVETFRRCVAKLGEPARAG